MSKENSPILIRNATDEAYADFVVRLREHVEKYEGVYTEGDGDWIEVTLAGVDYRVFYIVYDQAREGGKKAETSRRKLPTVIDVCHQCPHMEINAAMLNDRCQASVVCRHPRTLLTAGCPIRVTHFMVHTSGDPWVDVLEKITSVPDWCPLEKA